MSVTRTVRGKRPKIYAQEGMDHLMKGIILSNEIESFELDQSALENREAWRNQYMARIFAIFEQEAAELAAKDTSDRYQKTLDDIAVG